MTLKSFTIHARFADTDETEVVYVDYGGGADELMAAMQRVLDFGKTGAAVNDDKHDKVARGCGE